MLVVGDVLADLAVRMAGPLALESDTEPEIAFACGGSAANVASYLVGLGIATALVGVVGDDQLGATQLDDLRQRGVAVRASVLQGASTGVVVVLVGQDGRRSMLTSRGASRLFRPGHLALDLFRAGVHLHLSGYVLLDMESRETGLAALEAARRVGMTISVDANSHVPLAHLGGPEFGKLSSGASVLFANEEEAASLTGAGSWEEALHVLVFEYGQVVLKRGERGAVWASGQERLSLPAVPATVHDTTGAGDALAAAWLAGWLRGQDPEANLQNGLEAAARALSWPGGRPPIGVAKLAAGP